MNFDPVALSASDIQKSSVPGGLELLNRRALEGGKRMRPEIMFRLGRCLGVDREKVLPYAIAAERIHNATLLHDDVIDEASVRRGKPTVNVSGENRKAILAGDLLLAQTLRDLAKMKDTRTLSELFDVLVDLTEGEWLQLESRGILDIGLRHLREVARKKTASLLSWCFATPAHLAGKSETVVKSFRECGVHLGIAFQLWDDTADFSSGSGKSYAQDLKEGQVNFVIQDLLERKPAMIAEIRKALSNPSPSDFKQGLRSELEVSKRRVLSVAEVELAAADFVLAESGVTPEQLASIRKEVLLPFRSWLQTGKKI